MSLKDYPTREDNTCHHPGNHAEHLCALRASGRMEAVKKKSDRPAYACFNCGARANEMRDVCAPTPLEGG